MLSEERRRKLKHYATFQGEKVIVLGYNHAQDNFLIIRPRGLTQDEQEFIDGLIVSSYGQRENLMRRVLEREQTSDGEDAWLWAVNRSKGLVVPGYEIVFEDAEQARYYRGSDGHTASKHDRPAGVSGRDAPAATAREPAQAPAIPTTIDTRPSAAPQADDTMRTLAEAARTLATAAAAISELLAIDKRLKAAERRDAREKAKKHKNAA